MYYITENIHEPSYFEPWGGAVTRWYELDGEAQRLVHEYLDVWSNEMEENGHPLNSTDINDWIWFDCEDWLADQCLNLDGTPIESA